MAVSIHGNNGVITTNGTAAAPSLAAPDTDTGLYFGTNLIHATTSGTERLRIDPSGRLGLGQATPVSKLHISESGSNTINIQLTNATTGHTHGTDGMTIGYSSSSSVGFINVAESGSGFTIKTGGTASANERLRITPDGPHLLLGGTDDVNEITESSSNAGMVIGGTGYGNGGLAIINSTSGTGRIYFGDAVTNNAARNRGQINYYHNGDYMMFATAGNEKLHIRSGGQLNLGGDYSQTTYQCQIETTDGNVLRLVTDSDDANGVELVLRKDSASPADNDNIGNIYFQGNDDGGNATFYSSIEAYSDDVSNNSENGYIRFRTRNDGTMAERLRILSDGRVSIGNNPAVDSNTKLHIEEASGECGVWIEGNTGGAGAYLLLKNNSTASNPKTYIGGVDAGGQGTSQIEFHNLDNGTNEGALSLHTRPASGSMQQRLYIKSDGKIGVGLANPNTVLHLAADAAPSQGSDFATLSMGGPDQALRKVEIGARRSTRGGDWDHVGIGFKVHESTDYNVAPVLKMVLDYDGHLGIGTDAPTTALEVKGDITVYNANNQGDIFFGEHGDVADSKALIRMDQSSSTAGELQFHTEHGGTLTQKFTIKSDGKVGVGTNSPGGRTGSIDISCDDTTTWSAYSDQRGEASLTLRNPSANTNTFTAMHFFSGGGTGSDITLAAVRKGNMEADFHVMRRINNAGSGNDNRPSVTMRGLGTGPRVIIWAEGDGDNNGDKQCGNHIFESQQQPGFNQYVYWNFKIGSASYSRAGSLRYHCTWSTGHASGSGYQIGTILWINNHSGGGTCDVREHLIYRRRYNGGHHYGWTSAPELEVFQNTNTGTNAGIVFRCQGHGSHNSNSYDMQTVVHLHIEHMSVAQNSITPRLERFGTSSVSGTGSAVSGARLGYCTFSDSAPVADSTDF